MKTRLTIVRPPAHRWWIPGITLALACAASGQGQPRPAEAFTSLTDDGVWCWFADPRAVSRDGKTYTGWVTSDGSIQAAALDHASGRITTATLRAKYQRDDHDNPAFLFLGDGRLMAFYSKHGGPEMNARVTTRPGDITEWQPERALNLFGGPRPRRSITYPNPVMLSAEANTIYLFWRGDTWKPTFSTSTDGGETWTPGREIVARAGAEARNRPYVKIASNNRDRIHIIFTDGHPAVEPANNVYYVCYRAGAFYSVSGRRIAGVEDLPITPEMADKVYDAGVGRGRSWVWDVAADAQDRPVITYARIPETADHRYHYARWNGTAWADRELCEAGKWFPQTPPDKPEREPYYSGGVVLDHANPSVVYLSRPVQGIREIERWSTADVGRSWKTEPITRGSAHDNVRPVVVRGYRPGGPTVLWVHVREHYVHYTNYLTAIKMDR